MSNERLAGMRAFIEAAAPRHKDPGLQQYQDDLMVCAEELLAEVERLREQLDESELAAENERLRDHVASLEHAYKDSRERIREMESGVMF